MGLDTNYYTTQKTDQKTIKILLRASFGNFESASSLFFFFFLKKKEMVGSYNGLKIL